MFSLCHVDPSVQALFPQGHLLSFWLDSDVGVPVSQDHDGREVRRIEEGGQVFFLKRSGNESLLPHLRMLFWFCRPRSDALREVKLLQALQSSGFAAMEPMAWGEESIGWLKVRGFLLVRDVSGQEVVDLFNSSSERERYTLAFETGKLIGRLHAGGFFHPVRLKDLILTDKGLVLIDRETSKPWKALFLKSYCLNSLARSYRRTCRDGHHIGHDEADAFLEGYGQTISSRLRVDPEQLRDWVCEAIRKETGRRSL
ncbi:MAG: hypothetical protein GX147_10145 [Deltaproteobacteria bacterium]|jgi:tRNA A-37 threonylcarbamoyl transferase component Bud32|nr:hypothetical protein [Deltaproteobacteria bacterium]